MLNKYVRTLLLGAGLWYLGEGMLGPLFTIFAQRMGGDILDITGAWAAYLFAMGALTICSGFFSDRINKRKIMVLGYALNALFTFGYVLVDSPLKLFLVQIGLGLASALATPTYDALYAAHENKKQDGMAWGLADGMPHLVTGAAILIGGVVVSAYSFTVLFVVMGCVQIVATLYQARILLYR
jgi:MFS family permease